MDARHKAIIASLPIPYFPMLMRCFHFTNGIISQLNAIGDSNSRVLDLSEADDVRITLNLGHYDLVSQHSLVS